MCALPSHSALMPTKQDSENTSDQAFNYSNSVFSSTSINLHKDETISTLRDAVTIFYKWKERYPTSSLTKYFTTHLHDISASTLIACAKELNKIAPDVCGKTVDEKWYCYLQGAHHEVQPRKPRQIHGKRNDNQSSIESSVTCFYKSYKFTVEVQEPLNRVRTHRRLQQAKTEIPYFLKFVHMLKTIPAKEFIAISGRDLEPIWIRFSSKITGNIDWKMFIESILSQQ